ncbi:MAG: four helix bundle protein [Anaerolineales bacterium]|jgi:four helix bundle protein|nr:four helix bundle protein [Chloroflexota bacterium]MBK6648205.1 four helix bundle protein [Anaerolineales bacterium]
MKYAEWQETVFIEIRKDPIWKLEVYRLALFAGDIGRHDVLFISKQPLMYSVADQLHRSLGSISANLTEGYSRSKGLDRARFIESSLGSARESRDWYYKSRHVLKEEVVVHRIGLTTHIIGMLTPMIPHQRKNAIREEPAEYITQSSTFSLDSEVPMP